jgi:hypothetical protein
MVKKIKTFFLIPVCNPDIKDNTAIYCRLADKELRGVSPEAQVNGLKSLQSSDGVPFIV